MSEVFSIEDVPIPVILSIGVLHITHIVHVRNMCIHAISHTEDKISQNLAHLEGKIPIKNSKLTKF